MRRAAWLAVLLLATGASGAATQQSATLAQVEQRLAEHRYADARAELQRWWAAAGETARGNDRARGLFLRAVLSDDPAAVERDLLQVAVEHPQAPVADRALLRLGQLRLAQRDTAGAAVFLERLVRDHPQSGERARALALLEQTGRAVAAAQPPAAREPAPRSPPATREPAARSAPAAPRPSTPAEYAPGVDYAVQAGAFASVADAAALRDRLRGAGFEAYLARIGGSDRTYVRVGTFRERAGADTLARRLRAAGFEAGTVAINLP